MIETTTVLLSDVKIWGVIILLAVVEVTFNLFKYYVGRQGKTSVEARFPKVDPEKWQLVNNWYKAWGPPMLLLMAIPVVSTLLAVSAGIHGYRVHTVVLWDFLAIIGRWWIIVFLVAFGALQLARFS